MGDGGTILATDNGGTTWTTQSSGTYNTLQGISCPNVTCFVVGANGTILSGLNKMITLSWNDVSDETGYKIERKVGTGGLYTQIGTTGANATTFNDTNGLFPAVTYYYRVRAYNASEDSAYSNEVTATTPGSAVSVTTGSALATQLSGSIPAEGLTINLTSDITLTGPLTIPAGVFINGGNCGSGAKTITTGGQNMIMSGGALLSNLNITGGTLKITGGGGANPVTAICTIVKRA